MKKLYSKILFTAILFFYYAQAVFAASFDMGTGLAYSSNGGCPQYDIKTALIKAWNFSFGFYLSLLIVAFCSFLFYFRSRKKNTAKINLLLLLGVLCLLLIVIVYFLRFIRLRNGTPCI